MSDLSDDVRYIALRWGIWVLSLGKIDIDDLMSTMFVPHDMEPFWLDEEELDPQGGDTGGVNQGASKGDEKVVPGGENTAKPLPETEPKIGGTDTNATEQKGGDKAPLVTTLGGLEGKTEKQGLATNLSEKGKEHTGGDKTEILKESKKEVESKDDDEPPQPSQAEKEQHIFESSMIRYGFRRNYYSKLVNKITALFGDQSKSEEAEQLLRLYYKYNFGFDKLLKISTFGELEANRATLELGFKRMAELEEKVKKLCGTADVVVFDQNDPGTWEPCAVRYSGTSVSNFVAKSYDDADLELRRTFQAGDRHQGSAPVTLNTPMHDHGSNDSQGISFKFLKVDQSNNQDRRVELYVYDIARSRKDNKYVWSNGSLSSGPSDAK